jgi:cell division septation protein DedD
MAHEIHDDGFHEIQLSGKQLVFLFMATTVVSIVIFLCGVLVGRGVQYARGGVPGASGLVSDAADGSEDEAAAAPASGEPTPVSGLSYPESLPARDGAPAAVVAGAASDLGKAPRSSAPAPAAAETPVPSPATPAATAPPKEAPAPREAPPPPAAASSAPAPAEDGGFTVQVTALKNKPEADAIAQRLQTRGYKAYVVAPGAGGQVIYKVRVGVNMQRQEADTVMRRLQNEEKFKPWITR